MNPSDLYAAALAALTSARAQMLSLEWQAALDASSPGQRLAASRELIQVQQAILALSNKSLSDIATEIQANSAEMNQSISGLQTALQDLQKVESVILAVSSLIMVVAKIVPLL